MNSQKTVILFLAANPKNTSRLRLDEEVRELDAGLQRSQFRSEFILEQRWAVRGRDIQRAMLDTNPRIVHFSGHGEGLVTDFEPTRSTKTDRGSHSNLADLPMDFGGTRSTKTDRSDYSNKADIPTDASWTRSTKTDRGGSFTSTDTPVDFGKTRSTKTDRGGSTKTDGDLNQDPEMAEGLVFEDEMGQAKLVSGEALGGLFALFANRVECVVLNGCYSATQAKTIARHIPYVVGMRQAIGDAAAIAFTRGFYDAMGAGRSIEESYRFGCNAIQLMGIPEDLTPVLISGFPEPRSPVPELEFPTGPVPLNSTFYLERFPNELNYYQSIQSPGCLLRIVAPSLMGKTSLMARILNYAEQQHYIKIYINLRDAEQDVLGDLDKFLHWFCDRLSAELQISNLASYRWDDETSGCIAKCSNYLERQILSQLRCPLVLGIDEIDRIFPYNKVASDFVGMLRSWFEKGRNSPLWQRLRLVLAYSLEDYSQFNIHQSPFNVGRPLRLRELTQLQVEDLVDRYHLNWQEQDIQRLMAMVGGNPFLVRLALYYVSTQEMTLADLLQEAPTEDSIYIDHLRRCWQKLSQQPRLSKLVAKIMASEEPVIVERSTGHQLQSIGLIRYIPSGTHVVPSCNLYRLYFNR